MDQPTSDHSRSLRYRADIDGLRAVAVAMVLAFHAAPDLAPGGYLGVDVFFVLSGFLITGLVLDDVARGRFSFAAFYARRIRRLVPALVLVLLAVWAVGTQAMLLDDFVRYGRHMAATAGFAENVLAWTEAGYFAPSSATSPLLHAWSLAVEEQFYLLWPVALVVGRRAGLRRRGALPVAAALGVALVVLTTRWDPSAAFYLLPARAWEFLAGAALVGLPAATGRGAAVGSVAALTGLGLALRFAGSEAASPAVLAAIPVGCTVVLLATGTTSRAGAWLSTTPLTALGRISYALYLWHWPLLCLARMLSDAPPSPALRGGLIALSVALASATHLAVERPLSRAVARGAVGTRGLLVGGLGALALVGALGAVTAQGMVVSPVQARERTLLERVGRDARALREGECLVSSDHGAAPLPASCDGAERTGLRVVVWGDSFAAALAPGLAREDAPGWAVSQYTAMACPPFAGPNPFAREGCAAFNAQVLDRLTTLRPDVVVVAADWTSYGAPGDAHPAELDATLDALRQRTPARVVVVGPQPTWEEPVPRLLARRYLRFGRPPPEALAGGASVVSRGVNDAMRRQVERRGATFADVLAAACDGDRCRVASGVPVEAHLLTWDTGHLTIEGSAWVAATVLRPVLDATSQAP